MLAWASDKLGSEMAFSKMRLMAPFNLCSVSMASSCTCFISCWKFSGVSLLRMVRRRLNSRRVLICCRSSSSTSSSPGRPREDFLANGFQAFSALFSVTSSLRDKILLTFLGSFLWPCWERRSPGGCKESKAWRYYVNYLKKKKKPKKTLIELKYYLLTQPKHTVLENSSLWCHKGCTLRSETTPSARCSLYLLRPPHSCLAFVSF